MNKNRVISRRTIVKLGVQVPLAATAMSMLTACGEGGEDIALCADPNSLSFGENSIRQANNYTEVSPIPDNTCLNCAFFTPEAAGPDGEVPNCGDCSIFEGLAGKNGYCDSWSTKDTGQG